MKVAVTSQGEELSSEIDPRFGRAKWLVVVDTETAKVNSQENTVDLSISMFGIQAAQNVVELNVDAVITGNIGPHAFTILSTSGINTAYHSRTRPCGLLRVDKCRPGFKGHRESTG